MLVITARISASADAINALTPAIAAMEQASRAEEGCFDYTFCRELNDPNTIRIVERWESEAALKAHFVTPHMAEFQAATLKLRGGTLKRLVDVMGNAFNQRVAGVALHGLVDLRRIVCPIRCNVERAAGYKYVSDQA